MRVLMLGWEFPPFFAGGLGMVCYELTKVLSTYSDVEITYIMPYGPDEEIMSHVKLLVAKKKIPNVDFLNVNSLIGAYMGPNEYKKSYRKHNLKNSSGNQPLYGKNLYDEVENFAKRVLSLSKDLNFDVIHAHDWLTYPAGVALAKMTGKPLVLHIHNTVYDRYLTEAKHEKEIELLGFRNADKIIAVSEFTRGKIINNYGIDPGKVVAIHNGGVSDLIPEFTSKSLRSEKVVLYAGRITKQKGPDLFLRAAKIVLDHDPSVRFLVAGGGDMVGGIKDLAHELGIWDSVHITGRQYNREEAHNFYRLSDIFVMPSVSEPFGIVPLEAVAKGTPTIISKQSGISEVLDNTFKVDFWDIEEMANMILGLLTYDALHEHMRESAFREFEKFNWDSPAKKVYDIYNEVI